ncbi:serine/arginine repetitive matrix protein 2-like isoform X2 [Diachasmimorpha longicaudata]|uniref:serine/arginine repetitive matrix protein 2-like isoform X2 n=1 Tax=Diachasmimorpha longicaudata TaxID=58733 RepID=UPI0030B90C0D
MSPRKTRRGRAKEADETISIPIEDSLQVDSPLRYPRSIRTRRPKDSKENSLQVASALQSPHDLVEDSPQTHRRARLRRTVAESQDSNTSLNTTRRRRKPQVEEEPSLSSTVPSVKKRKNLRKKKAEVHSPPEPSPKPDNSPDSDDNEVANVSSGMAPRSAPTNRRFRQLRGGEDSPSDVTTPESSPITVTLTPHRTTKTPRKSPVNLGSPKTHSLSPRRHSKTPRKLSVVVASPVSSDQSSSTGASSEALGELQKIPMSPSTDEKSKNRTTLHSKILKVFLGESKCSPASSAQSSYIGAPSEVSKEQQRTLKPHPKHEKSKTRTTLHSKTPKIVLKMSKSKSPPSARVSKLRRSLTKSLSPKKKRSSSENFKSHKKQESPPKNATLSKESRSVHVLLKRISPQVLPQAPAPAVTSSPASPRLTTRLHSLARSDLRSSTPRERAREIQQSLNVSGTSPLHVNRFYGSPRASRSASKSLLLEDESNPLISGDDSFGISGIRPTEDDEDGDQKTRSIHKNSTYELVEPKTPNLKNKGNVGDGTYELDDPTIPTIRSTHGKRILEDGESPGESKRTCRVRFASPRGANINSNSTKALMRSTSATPSTKLLKKRSPQGVGNLRRRFNSLSTVESPGSALKSSGADVSGKWSHKAQNESVTRLSKPRLSISLNDTSKKKKVITSAKKAPNFAQIHQKKFEKMESLVDAKKRIEVRHNALTCSNIGNIKGQEVTTSRIDKDEEEVVKAKIMTEPKAGFNRFGFKIQNQFGTKKNEGCNRFGFKVRKEEATKIVSRPSGAKLEERKEIKRIALKGVRTNKRFELLMKSRNMK